MMDVMIGVDPHKRSHTATMLDQSEREMARVTVRAGRRQVSELLEWADGAVPRRWAVESAGGMGSLLWQQLVAAGETVLDVPATLASRVRVLDTGQSAKSDPNDARSVAVAALRAPSLARVRPADDVTVCRLLSKRHSGDMAAIERHRQAVELVDEIDDLARALTESRARIIAGGRITHRLSRRGSRRLNHALQNYMPFGVRPAAGCADVLARRLVPNGLDAVARQGGRPLDRHGLLVLRPDGPNIRPPGRRAAGAVGTVLAMPAIAKMRAVVLDCPDPRALAEFYRALLGGDITYADDDWVNLRDGANVLLSFQRAPDYQAPDWPSAEHGQQFHIDVTVDDVDQAEPQVLALGARRTELQPGIDEDSNWRVYLDPVGHPFCLCWD